MRTTVDIPDALLARARERALTQGTTLREVVAEALRAALEQRPATREQGVRVPVHGGSGLQPGVTESDLFQRDERELDRSWPSRKAGER